MMLRWISLLPPPSDRPCRHRLYSPRPRPGPSVAVGPHDARRRPASSRPISHAAHGVGGAEELEQRAGRRRHRRRCVTPCVTRRTRWRPTSWRTCASATSWRTCGSPVRPVGRTSSARRSSPPPASWLPERPLQVGRAAADRVALVHQQPGGHRPAVVDLADHVGGRDRHVVEELLAELQRAVDLADLLHLDARLVDLHDEHREAAVLRHVPVGAGQAHGVVALGGAAAPDLRAVEDEDVAVALGPGEARRPGRSRRSARRGTAPTAPRP